MRRAPTAVVALCAAIAELVLVAAAGNQWVVDHLVGNAKASELPRTRELKDVLTSFPWRWTPESHQRMLWLGEIVAVVGLVIAVFLLMVTFVGPMRAPRRFVPVFLGAWGIVVALTQVAAIGRGMLAYSDLNKDEVDPERLGRWWFGVFDGPTAHTVLFGAASGLIVAIVAGIVAAVTGRRADEDEEIDTSIPAGPDEVPEWSAALGTPQPFGATQALGPGQGLGSGQPVGAGQSLGATQTIGGPGERGASERAASERASEPTQSWPPPDPTERIGGWPAPEPESTVRVPRPATPQDTTRVGPSASRDEAAGPAPTPKQSADDQWSSVTQSAAEPGRASSAPPSRPSSEPPSEITLPRAPQPTSELPPPGSVPGASRPPSGRLPLPEERESDES
jgi:hypothetical protein